MISLVQNKRCWRCWYVFMLVGVVFQPRFSRLLYSLQISLKDGAAGEDSAGNICIFTTDRTQPEPAQKSAQSEVYQDSPLAEERKLPTASPGGLRCEQVIEKYFNTIWFRLGHSRSEIWSGPLCIIPLIGGNGMVVITLLTERTSFLSTGEIVNSPSKDI